MDTIEFGEGISVDDLRLVKDGDNLRVEIQGTQDSVTITNGFLNPTFSIERFKFADGTVLEMQEIAALGYHISGSVSGTDGNDLFYGGQGNDSIAGLGGNDILLGGAGNDVLRGGFGDDIIEPGLGNDDMDGGTYGIAAAANGNDTYRINRGGGNDLIWDFDASGQHVDTIEFGEGITRNDLGLIREGANLRVLIKSTGDSVTITNGVWDPAFKIEQFKFADGSTLGLNEIEAIESVNPVSGTSGGDVLNGTASEDVLDGGAGDDSLSGANGDTLKGGSGDDSYLFSTGSGAVVINDNALPTEGNKIIFGEGITQDDLIITRTDGGLQIETGDGNDRVILSNFDPEDPYGAHAVESFVFADGSTLQYRDLIDKGLGFTATERGEELSGTDGPDLVEGLGGDDVIKGGKGNDVLDGGSGDDTYLFNLGDGVDTIRDAAYPEAGNTIQFGPGITLSDLSLSYDQDGLIIKVGDGGDSLLLEGFNSADASGNTRVGTFLFADGTTLSYEELLGLGFTVEGTSQDDVLVGTNVSDTLTGKGGNDLLKGGDGDDAYHFGIGDGVDTVEDSSSALEPNTLIFGQGITPESIRLGHDASLGQLFIRIGESGEEIRLTNFNPEDPYGTHAVEYFQFSSGQILTYNQLIDRGFDLEGSSGDDTLVGAGASDRISGGTGNDTIHGAGGNDLLAGGAGDDTYLFNLGDGVDVIDDVATAAEGNTLVFGEGITLEGLNRRITFQDNTLIIRLGNQGDEVHLTGFDPSAADVGPRAVQNFRFADGTTINYEQLVENTFIVQGDSQDDALTGTNMTDRLYGYEGFDRLVGGSGDDTLTGGTGNDELIGGEGNETYVFNLGDGVDTIQDTATAAHGNLILFGEGITRNDLSITRNGSSLTLHVGPEGDAIRLLDFDPSEEGGSLVVRTLEFSDGSRIQIGDLLGTEGDDVITTASGDDAIDGRGGNDTISTGAGSDTLTGGTGNDTLSGGVHNDAYLFNLGDGVDTIHDSVGPGEGNRIVFGPGIAPNDITFQLENTTLRINVGQNGDAILLPNADPSRPTEPLAIETFEFENQTEISFRDLMEKRGIHFTGTEGDDLMTGTRVDDSLAGLGGNDILQAGRGDDQVNGGTGSDTYIFGVGDGNDILQDQGGEDTLSFREGISLESLQIELNGNDLALGLQDGSSVLMKDWANPDNRIENFRFYDGTEIPIEALLVPKTKDYDLALDEDGTLNGAVEVENAQFGVTFNVKGGSQNGTFVLNPDGTWGYTPNENYNGADQVLVEVTNPWGKSAVSTIDLTIAPVNDLPVVEEIPYPVELKDVREISGQVSATDVDGDTPQLFCVGRPAAWGIRDP